MSRLDKVRHTWRWCNFKGNFISSGNLRRGSQRTHGWLCLLGPLSLQRKNTHPYWYRNTFFQRTKNAVPPLVRLRSTARGRSRASSICQGRTKAPAGVCGCVGVGGDEKHNDDHTCPCSFQMESRLTMKELRGQ